MAKTTLTRESQFVVGEEKILNYILASLCFALFLYGLFDAIRRHFRNVDYQSFVFALAIIPAWIFFRKARSNKVYIRINKTGIYHDGKLVAGWGDIRKVHVDQDKEKGLLGGTLTLQDNFILVVEYRNTAAMRVSIRKIPLTNTQNKSEEDVLAAVNFFWRAYKNENGF